MLLGQPTEVYDSITHAPKGGVDAHTRAGGNVLEIAFAIVAENHHSALLGRQHLHQLADIAAGLLAHDALFHIVVVQLERVDNIVIGTVGDNGHFAVAAEIVHNQVVGNTHNPMDKLVLVLVGTAVDSGHYLEESVLEDVVGHILVFDDGENVTIHLGLVAGKENIETGGIAIPITLYQLVVGERGK